MKSTLTTGVVLVGKLCLLLFMVAAFGSCDDVNCIKGEGRTETRTLALQPFTKVASNGSFKVYITQGATQKVEVKGEPNILRQLRTDISNAT